MELDVQTKAFRLTFAWRLLCTEHVSRHPAAEQSQVRVRTAVPWRFYGRPAESAVCLCSRSSWLTDEVIIVFLSHWEGLPRSAGRWVRWTWGLLTELRACMVVITQPLPLLRAGITPRRLHDPQQFHSLKAEGVSSTYRRWNPTQSFPTSPCSRETVNRGRTVSFMRSRMNTPVVSHRQRCLLSDLIICSSLKRCRRIFWVFFYQQTSWLGTSHSNTCSDVHNSLWTQINPLAAPEKLHDNM